MTDLILLVIKISLALSVFALGLTATFDDVTFLFRKPTKLLRAFLSMNFVMPAFAVILALSFDLHPAVKIALGALSVSPTPPILPRKALKAGGRENYAVSLLVAVSFLAIIWVPLSLEVFERIFAVPLQMPVLSVAGLVLASVLAPLAAGITVRAVAPEFARRAAAPCSAVATPLLMLGVLLILFGMREALFSLVGDGTLAALVAFAVVGLITGYLFGGPALKDRTVLGLYSATRHPGIAIAISQVNFPQQRLALAAVLLAALVSAIVSVPYLSWAKARQIPAAAGTKHRTNL